MSIPQYSDRIFNVKCNEISVSDKIFPSALVGDFQECSEDGVCTYGVGSSSLNEKGYCWIILRMSVDMDKMPCWRQNFKVRTWSCGVDKIFWRRDYYVFDDDGEIIGRSTSEWIVADINNHHPIRPSQVADSFDGIIDKERLLVPQNNDLALDYVAPKLHFPDEIPSEDKCVLSKYADYSELDHNHHVNNTRYIVWAYDALYKLGYNVDNIKKFDINYHSEVYSGERINLYHIDSDDKSFILGYKTSGEKVFAFSFSGVLGQKTFNLEAINDRD